jgi:type II protein arginine methyltransferase
MQALIPLPEPLQAEAGTTVDLELAWSETRLSFA